ncbi:hypothetical protein P152DRAFT_404103 [Eremomyces bilateralis CBS 781.70]|uniref:histidine kinase n=1 Tax=Eremomyces bilateralis CBS 781.70 TaxID=1392243 RepID=A0A6G1FTJ5_9PEZI|nr:uncharacterized protein P152DRAFT_404103 [Eremomyces bilateralis CBS 781.70]KAF1809060.1 hypothetical protein P152DRAFT_404103 [Eremomyces bilateralis CBS 781.70]
MEIGTSGEDAPVPAGVERMERLREEVNASISLNSQRARTRPSPTTTARNPAALGARRISPIKEEDSVTSLSPSLEASFNTPTSPNPQTTSTDSADSTKTVRGNVPTRTPAYPFPYVPGAPLPRSSSFQPFTALSPSSSTNQHARTPREYQVSEFSTPIASPATFMPGEQDQASTGSICPPPNLYELVLRLNNDPGLDPFWSNLTNILHDSYGAQRATLALPADAGELENVPWGQKASYDKSGLHNAQNTQDSSQTKPQSDPSHGPDEQLQWRPVEIPERPNLATRHSYAGYERGKRTGRPDDARASVAPRPKGLMRNASQASYLSSTHTDVSQQSRNDSLSFSDMDFSSTGEEVLQDPHARVFPILRALDHEVDPLIDSSGVNRVLEQGKLVALTRDYSLHDGHSEGPSKSSGVPGESNLSDASSRSSGEQPQPKRMATRSQADMLSGKSSEPTTVPDYFALSKKHGQYEEYEQHPTSPWSQSPAPSPAIQTETEESPFFNTGNVDEESFNPTASQQDYAQYGPIEAIGVDKASTVIHVPLIHPLLSQLMPFTSARDEQGKGKEPPKEKKSKVPMDQLVFRRAPIAILSVLSNTVPYSQGLAKSLQLLGPHLATSFHNAQQFTNARLQAVRSSHRRYGSGHRLGLSGMSAEPETLDDLLNIDLDPATVSGAGSLTSPSEYSSRSRHSPGGSISGTPGWDASFVGMSSTTGRHSVHGTPAPMGGAEMVESYFDAKSRPIHEPEIGSQVPSASTSAKPEARRAHAQRLPVLTAHDDNTPKPRESEEKVGMENAPGPESAGKVPKQTHFGDRRHTYLHSYGADFGSTFQSVPSATTVTTRTPGLVRTSSVTESIPMPPPSEKLLRIIVDSLPVQIFIAAPLTGALTWANSKFHVYRGQDSRQILDEPWQAVHPEDRDDYMKQWHHSLATGQPFSHKVRLQRFDGQYRWFFVRATPLKDRRQSIVHWAATYMDIHEQHVAEVNASRQQETEASEAKYRALANSSPQIVFVVTRSKGLTFCNSQWLHYSGQIESQALGLGFTDYVHHEDIAKCKLPTFEDDESSAPTNVPTSVPPEPRRPVSDLTQTPSDDSIETTKTVTSPGSTSPIPARLPQAQLSKLAGMGILKVSRDTDGRPSYSTEVRLKSKHGTYRWHLVRVQLAEKVIQEDEDELWYGTCTDINDHKLLEQTLKETMDAKSRFLSNMSHEIRTPLNGIIGMVNLLMASALNTEQMENVEILRRSTESLRNLINDILDLSKVEAGMITLSMDWLHVRGLIEEVNDLTAALAINKGLELNYLVEENVPRMLKGDQFRIRQVLLNVIGNAIKFTNQGEIFVHCRLCETPKGKDPFQTLVQFDVIDTGSGFTEAEAEYLFKRFSQLEKGSTRQHGGTGLGLAISMQLVELHGGQLTAKSVPGKGSTFTFTLNFRLPSDDDHPPTRVATSDSHPPNTTRRETHDGKVEPISTVKGYSASPVPYTPSPGSSMQSSGASSISMSRTARSSIQSERSSASSYLPESSRVPIDLELPAESREKPGDRSEASGETVGPTGGQSPAASISTVPLTLYSILVVCPLLHARTAIVKHIESCLPKTSAQHISAKEDMADCKDLLSGEDPVRFTHVVLNLKEVDEIVAFMDVITNTDAHAATSLVVISDLHQKKDITEARPKLDYERIQADRKLYFLFKPVKPSKVAEIFDPWKEHEMSKDRNMDSAQATAMTQKQLFEDLSTRFGKKGYKVMLVEDNPTNQQVLVKFMKKANIDLELVQDGVQCVDAVFVHNHDYYSIILCDLHMPNKDGFETCKEIRAWERKNQYPHMPIIALSANVMGDVYNQCVEAQFNSYVTKPVDFKEMSDVLGAFLDPPDPTKPLPFMRPKQSTQLRR